ncbi:hypothetical protein CPB97_007058 [Podila verticillata]|nr:hypothetical protein CPB97_007058 [Podila verticillata]
MPFSHEHWPSKVANIIVYLTLVSGNLYSVFGGHKDQDNPYDPVHASYVTPAPFTFGVWTVIHFLFGGLMVFQWFSEKVHDALGWHFVLASLLTTAWLALFTSGHAILAMIALFFATGAVSYIYYRLKEDHSPDSLLEVIFLALPFSLYHAWIFVLLFVNVFVAFSPEREDGPSTFQVILAVAGLAFVASTVVGYIEYKKGDVAGALVLAWYLFGVFAQQQNDVIHWSSLGFGIIATLYTLKPFVLRVSGRHTPETAPLLG